MGTRTPNLGIYKIATAEQLYSAAFNSGLDNIDNHDHTGSSSKGGKQIPTGGIVDNAITVDKLAPTLGNQATVQTTDATATQVAAIDIDEGQGITVEGRFNGLRDDYTECTGGRFYAVFRRPSGGNVTLVGSAVVDVQDDSSGSPTMTITADTGNQTIDLNCVGEAAKTFNWTVFYSYTIEE